MEVLFSASLRGPSPPPITCNRGFKHLPRLHLMKSESITAWNRIQVYTNTPARRRPRQRKANYSPMLGKISTNIRYVLKCTHQASPKKNTYSPAAVGSGAASRAPRSFWPLNHHRFPANLHLSPVFSSRFSSAPQSSSCEATSHFPPSTGGGTGAKPCDDFTPLLPPPAAAAESPGSCFPRLPAAS